MSQVAADPAITSMKSRRRIASPKAWDYFDLAFNRAITAGIRERQNGRLFAEQQLRAAKCRDASNAVICAAGHIHRRYRMVLLTGLFFSRECRSETTEAIHGESAEIHWLSNRTRVCCNFL
jgi:hypothetical protein